MRLLVNSNAVIVELLLAVIHPVIPEVIITPETNGDGGCSVGMHGQRLHPGIIAGRQAVQRVGFERGGKHGGDLIERSVAFQLDPFHYRVLEARGVVSKHLCKLEVGGQW